jgi:exodeoxyribonuclease V alpha subunit
MSLLRDLQRLKALRPLDDALANTLRRLDPDTPDAVLAAAALASLAVAQGHAGFDLARPRLLVDADLDWPAPADWAAQLAASPFVATPADADAIADPAPLAFERSADGAGLLYLRRYREYERRLALQLRRIAAQPMATDIAALAPTFARLFPQARDDDRQARAAALALRRALLLVTGGPGTGKTTTIARLLALRVAAARQAGAPPPRIALAAPTGRAADRMADSLRRATDGLAEAGLDADVLAALPTAASTLHRLLGVIPDSPDFRHHAGHPLALDLLVVDEASMVDLPLMCKLAEAVPDGAQLILLGDADQLPSVEAGDVLAAILEAAGAGDALAADDAAALAPLLGEVPAVPAVGATNLRGHRVHLVRGWRQHDSLQLAPLADAIRAGDVATARALLQDGALANVHLHPVDADPLQAAGLDLLPRLRALATASDPAQALRDAGRLRLLTALREGPFGARGLNARIEAQLSGRRIGSPPAWYPGRLLLVTENSPRHGLFNGDVGICLPAADGALLAWFAGDGAEGVRTFHPAALPAHDSAFAMTVHKAQGSEFDTVWLQLPRQDARVLSRELLYTAITRARRELHVAGSLDVIAAALSRHASRVSGLGWRLGASTG